MPLPTLEDVIRYVDELDEQYQREQKQAIMQRSMEKAIYALAGQESCERLRNWLQMRTDMRNNVAMMTARKARR